jgi:hypothetical protein
MPIMAQTTNAVDQTIEIEGCAFFDTYGVTLRNGKLEQTDGLAALMARGYVVVHIDDLPPDLQKSEQK